MAATKSYSSQGAKLYILNKTVSPQVVAVVVALAGLDGLGGDATSVDKSNFDSAGYMEYAKGLVDPGKPGGDVIFNFNDPGHLLLQKLLGLGDGSETAFFLGAGDGTGAPTIDVTNPGDPRLIAPVSTSPVLATRSGVGFVGFVASFTKSAAVNDIFKAKLSIQASGGQTLYTKGLALPPIV